MATETTKVMCAFCGATYSRQGMLDRHINAKHIEPMTNSMNAEIAAVETAAADAAEEERQAEEMMAEDAADGYFDEPKTDTKEKPVYEVVVLRAHYDEGDNANEGAIAIVDKTYSHMANVRESAAAYCAKITFAVPVVITRRKLVGGTEGFARIIIEVVHE